MTSFSKKWFLISFAIHSVLLLLFFYIRFEPENKTEYFQIDIVENIDQSEIIVPDIEEIPLPDEISPLLVQEDEAIHQEIFENIEVLEEPKTYLTLPDDYLLTKNSNDSLLALFRAIDSVIVKQIGIDASLNSYTFMRESETVHIPTMQDTLRLILDKIYEIVNEARMSYSGGFDPLKASNDEYNKNFLNPTIPILALIPVGIKLVGKLAKKIFKTRDIVTADKMLTVEEIEVMLSLWKLKSANEFNVYSNISLSRAFTIQTVISHLKMLEIKGIVCVKDDLYIPLVTRNDLFLFFDALVSNMKDREGNIDDFEQRISSLEYKIKLLASESF